MRALVLRNGEGSRMFNLKLDGKAIGKARTAVKALATVLLEKVEVKE